jgi:hypothetical protein
MDVNPEIPQNVSRRRLLSAGAIGVAVPLVAAGSASAATPAGKGSRPEKSVAERLAQLEYNQAILQAKAEITERQSLYGLLFNGDGPHAPDRAKWGKEIFVGNQPFLAYDSDNQLIAAQSFEHMSDEIAGAVATEPAVWPNTASANGSMHYMFAPVFDKITLTEAVTRTPSVSISGVKGTAAVNSATIRVYFDHWENTKDGWRKITSTWYRLD